MSTLKECKVVLLPTENRTNCLTGYKSEKMLFKFKPDYQWTKAYLDEILSQAYHLYILSDDEIKMGEDIEGEIIYNKGTEQIYRVGKRVGGTEFEMHTTVPYETDIPPYKHTKCSNNYSQYFKRVIATTDKSLKIECDACKRHKKANSDSIYTCSCKSLPQPSQGFIEKYIEKYNINQPIEKVMVEYQANQFVKDGVSRPVIDEGVLKDYKGDWIYAPKVAKDNTITIRAIKDSWNREEVVTLLKKMFIDRYKAEETSDTSWRLDKWIKENL